MTDLTTEEERYRAEGCQCGVSEHPPCGWCENGDGEES